MSQTDVVFVASCNVDLISYVNCYILRLRSATCGSTDPG